MNLFYSAKINPTLPNLLLSEEESAHCIKVLRKREGDTVFFTDGIGNFYETKITSDHPKKCIVEIQNFIPDENEKKIQLSIAIAPTKKIDRFEWFLEKATEIGCYEIIPILCAHSERKILKMDRLLNVIISSLKQCLKSRLPLLNEMKSFEEFLESMKSFEGKKFIGHIPELSTISFPPKQFNTDSISSMYKKDEDVLVAIGPEGGFSEKEIFQAIQYGFIPISLGNSRLRVETAGIVACAIINHMNI